MKPEDVYKLGPEVVSTEMIEAAKSLSTPQYDTNDEQLEDAMANSQTLLEIAQDYFRRGAFEMEHKDGVRCEAEDQGGHPCCAHAAEFFVKPEHLDPGEKRRVYCAQHRAFNRFYRADQMAPIYENPASGKKEA